MDYVNHVGPLDASGKKLPEVSDVVIDDCGVYGDASIWVDGMDCPVAPTSTVTSAFISNCLTIRVCEKLREMNLDPPVFRSANMDGAGEYNLKLLNEHKDRIFYML